MERKVYSYREALNIVEDFMIKSGIRKYCEMVCKGQCCGSYRDKEDGKFHKCWESKNACWKNEGRRLPCSIFICSWLLELLPDADELAEIREEIVQTLWNIMKENPYYHPNTPKIQQEFSIEKEIMDKIKSFNIREYRKISNFLIERKIDLYYASFEYVSRIKHEIEEYEQRQNSFGGGI